MGKAEAQAVPLTLGGKVTLRSTSRAFSLFCVAGAPSHAAIRSLAFFLSSQIRFRGFDCHILRVFRAIGSVFKSPHAFSFSHPIKKDHINAQKARRSRCVHTGRAAHRPPFAHKAKGQTQAAKERDRARGDSSAK